jgi:hypothetical protein
MNNKRLIIGFVFLIIVFSLWYFAIVPEFEKMPGDFHYNAEVISIDNFYNGELQNFSGPIFSETEYSIETVFIEGKILELKVIFDVRKLNGEEIFKVKRIYGVDR